MNQDFIGLFFDGSEANRNFLIQRIFVCQARIRYRKITSVVPVASKTSCTGACHISVVITITKVHLYRSGDAFPWNIFSCCVFRERGFAGRDGCKRQRSAWGRHWRWFPAGKREMFVRTARMEAVRLSVVCALVESSGQLPQRWRIFVLSVFYVVGHRMTISGDCVDVKNPRNRFEVRQGSIAQALSVQVRIFSRWRMPGFCPQCTVNRIGRPESFRREQDFVFRRSGCRIERWPQRANAQPESFSARCTGQIRGSGVRAFMIVAATGLGVRLQSNVVKKRSNKIAFDHFHVSQSFGHLRPRCPDGASVLRLKGDGVITSVAAPSVEAEAAWSLLLLRP